MKTSVRNEGVLLSSGSKRKNHILYELRALERLRAHALEVSLAEARGRREESSPPRRWLWREWLKVPANLLLGSELHRSVSPGRPSEPRHVWEPNPYRPLL